MKTIQLLTYCFVVLSLYGQIPSNKGVSPLPKTKDQQPTASINTYAVVIGISDYADERIPDLRYADRDAAAFANWLRAPEGLALPDSSIRLLVNRQATTAQMIVNLDWLIETSKPGDRVFIYFSGHGDVERVTKFNLGYLLSYDSPPAVYGAGAFSLQYLQAILSTLSENNVQVFMITDACRAGKLSGNSINGTQVTAKQLSQQFANEIKILSCQPDEFSLEGEQWGGGRGCFSYHLEDALYGFADADHNQTVDLLELRRYLEDRVHTEAAPESQLPMVSGPMKTEISAVREAQVAARRATKGERLVAFKAIENKGMEGRILAKMDTSVQQLYAQFSMAIDSGHLMSPSGKSANDYFITLMEKPEMTALSGTMKRRLAAALMDEGQTVINKILQTDPAVLDNIWANRVSYDHLPAYLERAGEILGEKHYIWRDLKAKEYYFSAMTIRKENYPDSSNEWRISEKRRLLEKSLLWDSASAVVQYHMGHTFSYKSKERVSSFQKAAHLAPNWALVYYDLGLNNEANLSINFHKMALALDSNFLKSYNWIALPYDDLGQRDSAMYYRNLFVNKMLHKLKYDSTVLKAFECNALGNALWRLRRYEEAKIFLRRGEAISVGKNVSIYGNLTCVYTDLLDFQAAIRAAEKVTIEFLDWYEGIGTIYYFFLHDAAAAAAAFAKAKDHDGVHEVQFYLRMGNFQKALSLCQARIDKGERQYCWYFFAGESALKLGLLDSASAYFKKISEPLPLRYQSNDYNRPDYIFTAIALRRVGKETELLQLLDTLKSRLPDDPWMYFNLATIYAQTHPENAALESLQKAIELGWKPNPLLWLQGTLCDPMLNPIRETDAFKALVRKHFPKYYDIATRIPGKK